MNKKKVVRFILTYVLSGISFFLLTMPFHKIFAVFTVSEVRPSAVLYPLLGTCFGWSSALGIMTANAISDIMNGYTPALITEGLVLQLLYAIVPYYLWKKLTKGESHRHRLDSISRILKYVAVCFIFSVLSAIGVGTLIYLNYHTNPTQAALFVLLNNFDISVILGCPLMVISNQIISRHSGTKRVITSEERIIIITAIAQIIVMTGVMAIIYSSDKTIGTYSIWNSIYIIELVFINLSMLISLAFMMRFRKKA